MIRFSLVGAGRIGAVHAASLAASPDIRLVAVADVLADAAQALAERHGAAAVPVHRALEDPEIDAVLIASSTDTHAELLERASVAGKAILCEKPIDLDLARAEACVATVEETGVPVGVGFNRRFDASFAALKARLDEGEIGTVEIVQITSRDPGPPPLDYIRRSGGLYRDMMIHDFDMARWLLGEEPVLVHALGSCHVDPAIGQAGDVDTAVVVMRTASGRLCQIGNSRRATYGYDQRIEVHGSKGMLAAGNPLPTTVTSAGSEGYRSDPLMPFFLERYGAAYRAEIAAFAAALAAGKPPQPTLRDGLAALRLADAADRSRRTGQPVTVGS